MPRSSTSAKRNATPETFFPKRSLGLWRSKIGLGFELPFLGRTVVEAPGCRQGIPGVSFAGRSGLDICEDRTIAVPSACEMNERPRMSAPGKTTLHTMLGNYPITNALKSGAVPSALIDFDFAEVKVANNQFKKVVRDAAYDVAELAIATYLQAEVLSTSPMCCSRPAGEPWSTPHHRL